jgi:hypothetical protein
VTRPPELVNMDAGLAMTRHRGLWTAKERTNVDQYAMGGAWHFKDVSCGFPLSTV